MKAFLLSLTLLLNAPMLHALTKVAGVELANTIQVAKTQLQLNGAGIRKKFFISIYVGALYLPKKAKMLPTIAAQPGPKQIFLKFLYKKLPPKKLVHAWNEGFASNLTPSELKAFMPQIKQFNALFDKDAVKGMTYQINYIPNTGTQLLINNQLQGTIKGAKFYQAILKIWLGEKPADKDLKQAMLGQ